MARISPRSWPGPAAGAWRVVRGNDFFASERDSARPASR